MFSLAIQAEDIPATAAQTKPVVLDKKILMDDESKGIDSLFKNMIVVQKKAIERKDKFILFTNFLFDFSDNPKTMYCASVGIGYALLENLELQVSVSPFFISNDRASVKAVRQLQLADGATADLVAPNPTMAITGSAIWVFAYGKDAYGPYSIIRSDTFLKLSYAKIQYKGGLSGGYIAPLLGKTFFISKYFNFRLAAGIAQQTSYINQQVQKTLIGLIEPGFIWFL
jgi:hypothetical protein